MQYTELGDFSTVLYLIGGHMFGCLPLVYGGHLHVLREFQSLNSVVFDSVSAAMFAEASVAVHTAD
jgi:hypothetical protein